MSIGSAHLTPGVLPARPAAVAIARFRSRRCCRRRHCCCRCELPWPCYEMSHRGVGARAQVHGARGGGSACSCSAGTGRRAALRRRQDCCRGRHCGTSDIEHAWKDGMCRCEVSTQTSATVSDDLPQVSHSVQAPFLCANPVILKISRQLDRTSRRSNLSRMLYMQAKKLSKAVLLAVQRLPCGNF